MGPLLEATGRGTGSAAEGVTEEGKTAAPPLANTGAGRAGLEEERTMSR